MFAGGGEERAGRDGAVYQSTPRPDARRFGQVAGGVEELTNAPCVVPISWPKSLATAQLFFDGADTQGAVRCMMMAMHGVDNQSTA